MRLSVIRNDERHDLSLGVDDWPISIGAGFPSTVSTTTGSRHTSVWPTVRSLSNRPPTRQHQSTATELF